MCNVGFIYYEWWHYYATGEIRYPELKEDILAMDAAMKQVMGKIEHQILYGDDEHENQKEKGGKQ